MPTQEENAKERYEFLRDYIKKKGKITVKHADAIMGSTFGIKERTTGQYLGWMKTLELVKYEGEAYNQTVVWIA
jgi:hypothetical protein